MATTDFVVKNGLVVNQNLSVKGTAVLEQSLTLNGDLVFEGSSADANETTITVTNPTADRTITFPDATGTVAVSVTDTTTATQGELNLDFTLSAAGNVSATGTAQGLSITSTPEFAGLTINGSSITFEGSSADANETTLTVTNPTADRTITFPDATGTVAVSVTDTTTTTQGELNLDFTLSAAGNVSATGTAQGLSISSTPEFAGLTINGSSITFEGSSADANETTLTVTNPTADRTITFPDITGTVVTTGDTGTVTNTMLAGSIANAKLVNSAITINSASTSLGGSVTLYAGTTTLQTSSANQALTGITSVALPGSTSGTVTIQPAATAGTTTITFPATTGTVITSGDTGTVTNTMLAGSIANAKLVNSAITINSASTSLGGSVTLYAGTTTLQTSSANQALTGITSVALPGATSGTVTIQPAATAGTTTITFPATTGTVITSGDSGTVTNTMLAGSIANAKLSNSAITINSASTSLGGSVTLYAGTTTLQTSSANQALTGITSVALPGATSGTVTIQPAATAGTTTITFPATTGTVVTTGDSGTVTNTMLAGSIANAKLSNSSITINSTSTSLGGSVTLYAGSTALSTTSGAVTLPNSALTNSTISGVALGSNLNTLTLGSYLTGTSYNGSSAVTAAVDATTAATASKVVARDANADIACRYITTTRIDAGDTSTAGTVRGQWTLEAGSTWAATVQADLAEWYQSDVEYEPGTVLIFGGEQELTISSIPNDTRVAGAVTTAPAFILQADLPGPSACIALQGKIPVKVIGQVAKGDLLVTSHIPGVAMVNNAAAPYTVLGKALENKTTEEQGVIQVSVGR